MTGQVGYDSFDSFQSFVAFNEHLHPHFSFSELKLTGDSKN